MADLSNISVTGHLTHDAQQVQIGASNAVKFDMAVNTGWGQYARTAYYTVTLWGKSGTNVLPYLQRGKCVAVGGEFDVQAYKDPQGIDKVKLCISTNRVTLLSIQANPQPSANPTQGEGAPEDDIPVF